MDDTTVGDICRVCRCEGAPDKPLFHPCICTGSIKFIHQDCLVQWLKYSEKEYCELCNHRFSFIPIYSPDMPTTLPIRDVLQGLLSSLATASRFWLQLTLVAVAWLGVVPLTAYRIYKCLFSNSASAIFSLPLDLLSTDHIISDAFYGCCVVTCTLCSFISLVWLREQILRAGPDWLINHHHHHNNVINNNNVPVNPENPADDAQLQVANANADAAAGDGDHIHDDENAGNANDDANNDPIGNNDFLDPVVNAIAADVRDAAADHAGVAAGGGDVPDGAGGGGGVGAGGWDRAADELTWERILGLDGSLVFLEHVLWVICLNTLFILVFAFVPFHIGDQIVSRTDSLREAASLSQFSGLVTTLFGYIVIGLFLVLMHGVTCLFHLRRSQQILGLCYVTVKVSLLSVFELGVFPLICGVWLDICSLPMLGSRLEDRHESFKSAPGTSLFIHWLVGMIYVFYFASFILLLREVVRPGVLWFLQNLNDPDFNPIQEMIHLPIVGHARRFLASMVIFGSTVLLLIWFPVLLVQSLIPGLLPFHVSIYPPAAAATSASTAVAASSSSSSSLLADILSSNTSSLIDSSGTSSSLTPPIIVPVTEASAVGELSLEFLLLQLVLPALLDHGHLRQWLKSMIRNWCILISYLLGIRSYLLGDVPITRRNSNPAVNDDGQEVRGQDAEPAAADDDEEPLIDVNEHPGDPEVDEDDEEDDDEEDNDEEEDEGMDSQNQPYIVPSLFPLRIVLLLSAVAVSILLSGVVLLSVPVLTGRKLISLWLGDAVHVHELNTAACGLYVGLVTMRLLQLLAAWLPRGIDAILLKVREGLVILAKTAIAGIVLLGIIPLLIGILFDVVIIVPLRVPTNQSPIFYLWQDWAFGVLHTKVICGIAMLGPADFRLRHLLEQMYQAGLVNMDLNLILWRLAAPVITILGLALAIPYLAVSGILPLIYVPGSPESASALLETETLILRRVYPSLLFASVLLFLVTWHVNKYWRLLEHIKNDKYLVGKRLVNYDPKSNNRNASNSSTRKDGTPRAGNPPAAELVNQQQPQNNIIDAVLE